MGERQKASRFQISAILEYILEISQTKPDIRPGNAKIRNDTQSTLPTRKTRDERVQTETIFLIVVTPFHKKF